MQLIWFWAGGWGIWKSRVMTGGRRSFWGGVGAMVGGFGEGQCC